MPRNMSPLHGPGFGLATHWRGWAEIEGLPLKEVTIPKLQGGRAELALWLGSGQRATAQGSFLTTPWWPLAGLKGPNPSSWARTSIQNQSLLSGRDLTKTILSFTQLKDQQRRNSAEKFPSGHIQRPWWKP